MSEIHLPSRPENDLTVKPETISRVTVVENLYHQRHGEQPTMATGDTVRFSRRLYSDEQPYERRVAIKDVPQPLDHGWIDHCGMLMLRNDEGHFAVNPTDEQRDSTMRRVVEVLFNGKVGVLVPPQETCRFYPADVNNISLRCREGVARCTLYLTPE